MLNLKPLFLCTLLTIGSVSAYADAASADAKPGIDRRQANQERRIEQGIDSGQLTRREARRLEREQSHIGKAEARTKSDGAVTRHERKRLHRMQNRASKHIGRQKHDGQVRR